MRLAKQLATLDRLSGGRLLVTFVLGLRRAAELDAMGVGAGDRGRQLDELLPLLRRLWTEDDVDHDGESWQLHGVTVEPKPLQRTASTSGWGAVSPARCAGPACSVDGWLPALCTPEEAAAGRRVIEDVAAEAGRRIDPEHFGVSIGYTRGDPPEQLLQRVAARHAAIRPMPGRRGQRGRRPTSRDLVPDGVDGAAPAHRKVRRRRLLEVRAPARGPARRRSRDELKELADGVLDLQT